MSLLNLFKKKDNSKTATLPKEINVVPERTEKPVPLTLQERLSIYKKMKGKITEKENGYNFKYIGGDENRVATIYKEISNHLVVVEYLNYIPIILSVFELNEEKNAKEFCYKQLINYIRKNTHFKYDEFWGKNTHPYDSTKRTIVQCIPEEDFNINLTPTQKKFFRLDDYSRYRINQKREDHNLEKLI